MRYRYLHITAALFLIIGMGMQAVVSYRRASRHVQEQIELQTQLAQEKLRFELYDAYDATVRLENFIKDEMTRPEDLLEETRAILKHYPQFFTCYVAFPEYRYPEKGKWYCPCSYRVRDSLITIDFGDAEHDYFTREWYIGALASGEKGFWSQPYHDEDFEETIFTHSDDIRDKQGNLIGVATIDFSVSWLHQLLEQYKPFDKAVFVLYSSSGEPLAVSGKQTEFGKNCGQSPIVSHTVLQPIDLDLVMVVPRSYIWASIRWGIGLPFVVFLLGIIVVAVLFRRMWRDREESAKLELMQRDMQIAHDIQMGILRRDFPKDNELAIHAELIPMREVGGDLYDFCRESDNLWFIIGDVSGKGVPAAMFMSAAVNLFRATGVRANSPKKIMEEMNAVLSENNPSFIFVTAFIGRLHIPSGQLLYCNAGHCEPLIVRSVKGGGACVESLRVEPNIPLGYDGTYKFAEQGCMLGEGEMLVLYTDGVTEARDSRKRMLGKQRWAEMVAQGGDLLPAVRRYIGEAEPTDDITLMTIRKLSAVQPVTLRVSNNENQWPLLKRTIHECGLCIGMDKRVLKKLELAAEEAVVNILHYSQATEIALEVRSQKSEISIQLTDDGVPFDPTTYVSDPVKQVDERQIGGLGISLIRKIADELRYQRTGNTNQLTIIKYI
ncbi:MAG: SpoIIE family protein phosphatase [Paludibacteraceae bacterium]|nr:SpoIIE family protein phosphatase [Paludibacteraceae bacterium]